MENRHARLKTVAMVFFLMQFGAAHAMPCITDECAEHGHTQTPPPDRDCWLDGCRKVSPFHVREPDPCHTILDCRGEGASNTPEPERPNSISAVEDKADRCRLNCSASHQSCVGEKKKPESACDIEASTCAMKC